MPRKVIIDVDPGIDGAVALAWALFDPRLEVVAVTATGGRVRPELATKNVQLLIEQLDPPRWPRIGAAATDQLLPTDLLQLHGADGLGNCGLSGAGLVKLLPAEKILVEEVRSAPEEVTVLALGPLTNIAQTLQRENHWAGQVGRLVATGGTLTGPGDITAAAEFNFYSDPLSARTVVRSRMTKTLVPLDVLRQLTFSFDLLDQLPSELTRVGKVLRRILPFAFRAQRQLLGREEIELPAVMSIIALTNPELFESQSLAIDVETEGTLTQGMTIFDRRAMPEWRANIEVLSNVDVAAARDCVLRGLRQAGLAS